MLADICHLISTGFKYAQFSQLGTECKRRDVVTAQFGGRAWVWREASVHTWARAHLFLGSVLNPSEFHLVPLQNYGIDTSLTALLWGLNELRWKDSYSMNHTMKGQDCYRFSGSLNMIKLGFEHLFVPFQILHQALWWLISNVQSVFGWDKCLNQQTSLMQVVLLNSVEGLNKIRRASSSEREFSSRLSRLHLHDWLPWGSRLPAHAAEFGLGNFQNPTPSMIFGNYLPFSPSFPTSELQCILGCLIQLPSPRQALWNAPFVSCLLLFPPWLMHFWLLFKKSFYLVHLL